MTNPVPEGPPGEFERMLGADSPDRTVQLLFDRMRETGDESVSDRRLPERPETTPPLAALLVRLALQPDDQISLQITAGDKILADVSMTYAQAAPLHENFGKLLDKIRPRT